MTQQKVPAPNYTQVPNVLLDEYMKHMSASELRVVLAAIRKIIGWHKSAPEPISITQFEGLTGMSRQGVINGIQAAVDRGILIEAGTGLRGMNLYTLNISDDLTTTLTSQQIRPELVNKIDQSGTATSQRIRHTKERDSKKGKKSTSKKSTPVPAEAEPEYVPREVIEEFMRTTFKALVESKTA